MCWAEHTTVNERKSIMQTTIDLEKLHALAGTVINDVGAISNAALVAAFFTAA